MGGEQVGAPAEELDRDRDLGAWGDAAPVAEVLVAGAHSYLPRQQFGRQERAVAQQDAERQVEQVAQHRAGEEGRAEAVALAAGRVDDVDALGQLAVGVDADAVQEVGRPVVGEDGGDLPALQDQRRTGRRRDGQRDPGDQAAQHIGWTPPNLATHHCLPPARTP